MSFKERISLIIDADARGAKKGLQGFGASIREADGFTAKFKAGATSAMDSVKANAGALALAGGAALVAFGVKALGAFTDVATGARDFGAATGMAVEDASRWIAIADDMGLTASDLQAAFGAVSKTLDDDKWGKYGIAVRGAGGEARDMNAIMLDTFDVLSQETNLTERARLGKELLGKGYAAMAPMIGKSRAEYEKMLGAVEKGQVITADELEKSERMRKAQDALSDALNEVTLAAGEFVAEMAPTIEVVAEGVTRVVDLSDKLGGLKSAFDSVLNPISAVINAQDMFVESTSIASMTYEELAKTVKELSPEDAATAWEAWAAANTHAERTAFDLTGKVAALMDTTDETTEAVERSSTALRGNARAAGEADRAYSDLKGEIDDEQAWLDMLDTLDDYKAKQDDATASDREKRRAGLAVQEELVGRLEAIDNLPAEKRTEILTMIEQGAYDEAAMAIGTLTAERRVKIGFDVGNMPSLVGSKYASGTTNARRGLALVGENGPEIVAMNGGETVLTAGQTRRALNTPSSYSPTVNLTIHAQSNATPEAIAATAVQSLTRWERDAALQLKAGTR